MSFKNDTILLTGGTGSFGKAFVGHLLADKKFRGVIRIFSRDEFKQHELQRQYENDKRLRFLIGDVRDKERLARAIEGAGIVVHAAALKQIPILEYNPFEAIKTNILGTQNVIDAAIDLGVKKALLISSDKACSPVNLYGATKMVAEKLFVQGNVYSGSKKTIFSVVRYGNVMGSRGSVVPIFVEQAKKNFLTITDKRMTRFWITLEQGVDLVLKSLNLMKGAEIFVPKLPSIRIIDLARAIAPSAKIKFTGIRPGEKLHEMLINEEESKHTKESKDYFMIEPEFYWFKSTPSAAKIVNEGFSYSSDKNKHFLTVSQIKSLLKNNS